MDYPSRAVTGVRYPVTAYLDINRDLVLLYWQIGNDTLARQQQEG